MQYDLAVTATVFATTMFPAATVEPGQSVFSTRLMAGVPNVTLTIAGFVALEMVKRLSAAIRQRSMVAVARVVAVVHVSIEPVMAMKPGPCADEQTTIEPVRAVITIRRAVIRRVIKISVGAYGRGSDVD